MHFKGSNRIKALSHSALLTPTALQLSSTQRPDDGESRRYKHDVLQAPSHQIRLLEIPPSSTSTEDIFVNTLMVDCKLRTYDRKKAPPYIAISYVWGDPAARYDISINGKTFKIAKNCLYVLKQIIEQRLHSGLRLYHLWLDAICIDQSNLWEKGKSVHGLAEVYKAADEVYACMGRHEDGTEAVFERLTEIQRRLEEAGIDAHQPYTSSHDPWHITRPVVEGTAPRPHARKLTGTSHPLYDTVSNAVREAASWRIQSARKKHVQSSKDDRLEQCLSEFKIHDSTHHAQRLLQLDRPLRLLAHREYWRRLWILQEIHCASKVSVLCGNSKVPLCLLVRAIIARMDSYSNPAEEFGMNTSDMIHMLDGSRHAPTGFDPPGETMAREKSPKEVFGLAARLQCADFHDRLYAVMDVISWPRGSRRDWIVPDYTTDKVDLVMQLAKCLLPMGTDTVEKVNSIRAHLDALGDILGLERDDIQAGLATLNDLMATISTWQLHLLY